MVDVYTKVVLTIIALALSTLAARPMIEAAPATAAGEGEFLGKTERDPNGAGTPQQPLQPAMKAYVTTEVPKTWGRLIAVSAGHVYFEASDGTIRSVPYRCGQFRCDWVRK